MIAVEQPSVTVHPTARFWDRIAERYAKKPVADEAAYQKKLQITRDYFRPDMEVLEFGCGTGSTALVHAPFVKHILAIDISAKMIEIAERKAKASNVTNVDFRRAGFDELAALDSSYDAVLGLSILHLLADRETAISKVYRMLKPGGVFVSSTPCIGDMMPLLRLVIPVGRFLRLFPPVQVFSAAELKASFEKSGFETDHEWQPKKKAALFMVCRKP